MSSPKHNPEEFQMGLLDHLRELRKRLLISIAAIAIAAVCVYMYATEMFGILFAPYFAVFGADAPLITTSPAEGWLLKVKVAVFAGALLVSPILFHQLWLFVAPGLYDNEKKLVLPFVIVSTLLFAGGALFCYEMVLPLTLSFFRAEIESIQVKPTIRAAEYLSMAVTTLLGFGAVFELPVISFFFARIGLIDHRFLIDWFKHAVVLIFILAAVLTPPDVLTQFLMAAPLLVLYGISIGVAYLAARAPTTSAEAAGALSGPPTVK